MNVQVAIRVRPFNKRERDMKCESAVEVSSNSISCTVPGASGSAPSKKAFTFDHVYDVKLVGEVLGVRAAHWWLSVLFEMSHFAVVKQVDGLVKKIERNDSDG